MQYRFKTLEEFKKEFGKEYDFFNGGISFVENMIHLAGVEISDADAQRILDEGEYYFKLDLPNVEAEKDVTWTFCDWMITPVDEIIGYKMRHPKYLNAMRGLGIITIESTTIENVEYYLKRDNWGEVKEKLEEEGLLDMWFEPIYAPIYKVGDWVYVVHTEYACTLREGDVGQITEIIGDKLRVSVYGQLNMRNTLYAEHVRPATKEEIELAQGRLPIINGYPGKVKDNTIIYGCAELSLEWFKSSPSRFIKSLVLSSDVIITETEMSQIRRYLDLHKLI